MSESPTIQIASSAQFQSIIQSSKFVITDFYADWCSPCKQIAPIFEQFSVSLSRPGHITFVKVNTDTQKEIAAKYNVSALPTFLIFKDKKPVEKVQGADVKKLRTVIEDIGKEAMAHDSSDGPSTGSGSGSGSGWRSDDLPKGYSDVSDQVDLKGLELLNADGEFGGVRVLVESSRPSALDSKGKTSEGAKDWVESDTDEQLMMFMPFQAMLKIHTIQITSLPPAATEDNDEIPMRPKTIHLYINKPHILGFEEAEDIPSTQTVTLAPEDWDSNGTANIALRFVKFQSVTSLVLFVMDGDGSSEKVRIDRLRIIGETGEKRDQGKLEKIDHDH